jgi:lipoprotein-releasing system permease protein
MDSQVLFYLRNQGLQSLKKSRGLTHELELRLKDLDKLDYAIKKIHNVGLNATNWEERDRSMLFALKMEKFIIATFISLSTLITGFSIITVLLILITQKRRDIGILMSMGLSRDSCRRIFIRIGMMLSGFGVVLGLGLGLLACAILEKSKLNILPNIYYDTSIPVYVDNWLVLVVFVVSVALSFFGSYVPTQMTLRYSPSEAIRSKSL